MAVVIVQTASRTNPLLQYPNIQLKSITNMAKNEVFDTEKVLLSDEITEKVIRYSRFLWGRRSEDCEYPFVQLEDGSRFYYNRFLFF